MQNMYYIGLDVHKRTISYCVKDGTIRIDAHKIADYPTENRTARVAPPAGRPKSDPYQ